MNKIILITFLAFVSLLSNQQTALAGHKLDSLGIKTIEGKQFILHKIEPKETLYALSRRYQVSLDDILSSNEENKEGYAIDQIGRILYIPLKKSVSAVGVEAPKGRHIVKSGETLYSLSKAYGASVADLKKWNKLQSNQLALGQELVVTAYTPKINNPAIASKGKQTHTVGAGETIYGIARKYNVTQKDIENWNNLTSNEIAIGQQLILMTDAQSAGETVVESKPIMAIALQMFHNAKAGETYADVAEMYNLFLPDLEKWNNFEEPFAGGEVIKIVAPNDGGKVAKVVVKKEQPSLGEQENKGVHIVVSGETIYSLSTEYDVSREDLRQWNALENYQLSIGQKLFISNPDAFKVDSTYIDSVVAEKQETPVVELVKQVDKTPVQDTKAYFTVEEDDIPKIKKVIEKGVAEVIEGSDNTEKYLALHRTAKIGTIMQVRNDLNDQIVFVRVLGKMPNTGVDEKVIIRISKKAFQKLGGVDYKFPVEISYLPLND